MPQIDSRRSRRSPRARRGAGRLAVPPCASFFVLPGAGGNAFEHSCRKQTKHANSMERTCPWILRVVVRVTTHAESNLDFRPGLGSKGHEKITEKDQVWLRPVTTSTLTDTVI